MIEKGICMADGKTGAIILAAGRSAHMEELKPMLRMGQTTMIQREIDTIRQAGISPDRRRDRVSGRCAGTSYFTPWCGLYPKQAV